MERDEGEEEGRRAGFYERTKECVCVCDMERERERANEKVNGGERMKERIRGNGGEKLPIGHGRERAKNGVSTKKEL